LFSGYYFIVRIRRPLIKHSCCLFKPSFVDSRDVWKAKQDFLERFIA
jgi:hypothetical protein